MRIRNIKNADEIVKNNSYVLNNPKEYRGHFNEVFGNDNPIHLEIGMGKGNFLISRALNNPDINFIGIEKYTSIVARALKKLEDLKVPNLKIFFPGNFYYLYFFNLLLIIKISSMEAFIL